MQAAFDELLDILRSHKLLPSINMMVTDQNKGIATVLKANDDTQHIQHLDDPFHIGKNLKKNALKKLNHAARQVQIEGQCLCDRYKGKHALLYTYSAANATSSV